MANHTHQTGPMDRARALRVIGVADSASTAEIQSAYWGLRAHIEERGRRSGDEGFRSARQAELVELDEAFTVATAAESGPRGAAPTPPLRRAGRIAGGILVAAGLLGVAAIGLDLWQTSSQRGGTASETGPEEDQSDAMPAALAEKGAVWVHANVEGAFLQLARGSGGQGVVGGPADGTVYELPEGRYRVEVNHPDCGDTWASEVDVVAGEGEGLQAELCRDTGWAVVRSNVRGDQLWLDGDLAGRTGPDRVALSVGEHEVRIEKPGFEDWKQTISVSAGEVVRVVARMRATPPVRAPGEAAPRFETERGGSRGWFSQVQAWLVSHYDADRSGLIDSPDEVAAISCGVWQQLERSYQTGGLGAPMSRLYGFDGSRWVKDALGFDFRVRGAAFERMQDCGLS